MTQLAAITQPSSVSSTSRLHRTVVRLPLAELPVGSYVLEVRAQSTQKDSDVVTRRIPLRVH